MSVLTALHHLLGQDQPAPAPQLSRKTVDNQRPNFRFQQVPASQGGESFGIQQLHDPVPMPTTPYALPPRMSHQQIQAAKQPQTPVDAPSLPANQFRTPVIAQPQRLRPKTTPVARLI